MCVKISWHSVLNTHKIVHSNQRILHTGLVLSLYCAMKDEPDKGETFAVLAFSPRWAVAVTVLINLRYPALNEFPCGKLTSLRLKLAAAFLWDRLVITASVSSLHPFLLF